MLLMRLIDTHCHLNDLEAFPDAAEAVQEAKDAGVDRLIIVGVDTDSSRIALEIANRFDGVFAVVGWHPTSAAKYNANELKAVEEMAADPKSVAIGEIGYDFHWDFSTPEQQKVCLIEQLDLAKSLDMPIVFHCREAYPELLDLLETRPIQPYLFHCFAGDETDAHRCMKLDAFFGVDGPITYKKNDSLRELVRILPKDRILIETDAPWMTPVPYRGKRNKPAWLPFINETLAGSLGMTPAECAKLTSVNADAFFRLGSNQP
jgi:TatD DNase family protein